MREITTHKVNGCNEAITIGAIDSPGHGGANHEYQATLPTGSAFHNFSIDSDGSSILIPFQKGPVSERGVNGFTNEILIALAIDRLRSFQRGEYSCRENAIALTHLEDAMHWLKHRTESRMKRGVEGTHSK